MNTKEKKEFNVQSLGSIQVGKGDNEAFTLVLRKSFNFITVAMAITCIYVWIWPESIVMLFGANESDMITEGCRALRIFAVCLIPFCYYECSGMDWWRGRFHDESHYNRSILQV